MTDDICQENAMEISNEGTGQDILNKLNVNRDEGNGYTYTIPYSCPSSYTHRAMSTSPLSYNSLVVDVRPFLQQHLHNGEMPIPRGPDKGRPPTLHHIDRQG